MNIRKGPMRRFIFFFIGALFLPTVLFAGKPLPPLQITLNPVQSGLAPENMKPGEVVAFRVIASALVDAQQARVEVDLSDGAEFVSGDLTWTGALKKNDKKNIDITVRVPAKGGGAIRARVVIFDHNGVSFSAERLYTMGARSKSKSVNEHRVRKDHRGRDVIEFP